MMILIYSIVVVLATTIGAIAGLGGGVIIKPLFDLLGLHSASTIGVYSCVAVFTMCIISIYKQIKSGFDFDIKRVVLISIGSIFGGIIGDTIFNIVVSGFEDNVVKLIQATLLLITLIMILYYTLHKHTIKQYKITNSLMIIMTGLFLGSISVFLGIGGGPMNVALLMIVFSLSMKEATVYSIATIFFSQLSKIISLLISGSMFQHDLSIIPFICISAIIGGFVGTIKNQRFNEEQIEKVFNIVMILLMITCIYNMVSNIS